MEGVQTQLNVRGGRAYRDQNPSMNALRGKKSKVVQSRQSAGGKKENRKVKSGPRLPLTGGRRDGRAKDLRMGVVSWISTVTISRHTDTKSGLPSRQKRLVLNAKAT